MKYWIIACVAFATSLVPVSAVVDDAQSYALEAATPWVEKGVELRYDYARGQLMPGGVARVSYQVFKGSEYWFFAGGSEDGVKMSMKVLDPQGQSVKGKTKHGNNATTFHFTAERTMMITIEVSGKLDVPMPFNWAVVYGFRSKKGGKGE